MRRSRTCTTSSTLKRCNKKRFGSVFMHPINMSLVEDSAQTQDKWKELMGCDLILLDRSKVDQKVGIPKNAFAEVGDAVRISFTGRVLGPDESHGGQSLKDAPYIYDEICKADSNFYYVIAEDWVVSLGDADILPALELGVRFLPQHHVGIVRCHSKFAHGSQGRSSSTEGIIVPANSSMEYSITIHEILKPSANYSPEIDLLRATWKKQIASDFYFHFGEYKKAFQLYKCASEICQSILNSPAIDQQCKPEETKRLLVDVYNNMALCQMKLNDIPKAKQSCQDALQHDPENIKALCRIAKCCIVLGQYGEAESSLDEAKSFQKMTLTSNGTESGTIGDSGSMDSINHVSNLLRHSKAHYKVKEKAMYKKMGKGIVARKQTHNNDTTPPLGNQTAALDNPGNVMHDSEQNSSTTLKITGLQNYPRIVFICSSVLVFIVAVLLQYFLRGKLQ